MDARLSILALPSLVVVALLVAHSLRTLPRARALLFWGGIAGYGILRGVALRWAIERLPGASFPYSMREPLMPLLGVPLQEIAGWAIVVYLGWWLGCRFSRYVFAQIAWACLFLGAVSWTVESAAVAAGWWSWSVPVTQPLLVNVPFIALVDWSFVGIDFLLPFLALTAPELRRHRARFLALLAFPLHFGAHALANRSLGPVPVHHAAHWGALAILLWLALRSQAKDTPFAAKLPWLPMVGLAVVVLDAAAVQVLLAGRPALLVSVLPTVAVAVLAWTLEVRPRLGRAAAIAAVGALVLLAFLVHARQARLHRERTTRLDRALAARDGGDLLRARQELSALAADWPGSHVPLVLLGEIEYRTERLPQARAAFARAIEIKQDEVRAYRYLAVIDRRQGQGESAARLAVRGLEFAHADPELLYLAGRRVEPAGPEAAQALAALAFEVGDETGAAAILDQALARWPDTRSFYPSRANLALRMGDDAAARRVASQWKERFPEDAP